MKNVVEFPDQRRLEDEASQWVVRLDSDQEPSAHDLADLRQWLAQSNAHREAFRRAWQLWRGMDGLSELAVAPLARRRQSWFAQMVQWLRERCFGGRSLPTPKAVAGLVLLIVAISLSVEPVTSWLQQSDNNHVITQIGESRQLLLADGSMVWLNTDSEITVDYRPSSRRINLLRGEAHFSVAKNPLRPFEVYADDRLVRAVGTAFSVYKKESSVKVMVSEGRVQLAELLDEKVQLTTSPNTERANSLPPDSKSSLQPRERILATLDEGQGVVVATGTDATLTSVEVEQMGSGEIRRRLSWREGLLVFSGDPLAEVIDEVSRYSSVKIEITDPELRQMRVGGQFVAGKTDELFEILEAGFGLTVVKIANNHFLVTRDQG